MPSSLLLTKLNRPTAPYKRISRPSLMKRLQEGFESGRQLTLISAPAGFGKTTCASEWLDGPAVPTAWLSLDSGDDDPARFYAYLLEALQQIDETIGQEIEGILRAGQLPPPDIVSATLINDILDVDGRFLLVLDDVQVLQDMLILQVLRTLVANLPPPLHLVLITREEPSLPLARLRANNQMTEIRAADLRFTGQETSAFLNETMGLSLDAAAIAALEIKTEGWIAGLQLAGLSLRDRTDPAAFIADLSGSHRHILSYLTEEVLNRQPAETQRFLLQTSILDKLTGDLCDAVSGNSDSRVLLEQLYNDNLFLIPLDDEQQWYRYHQLFAGLLRNRQRALYPGDTAELHRKAGQWYVQAGLSGEAIQHAIDAKDYEMAIALIETHYMDRLLGWHAKTVKSWMQSVPAQMVANSPRVNLAFAWMYLMSNDFTQAMPYIERLQVLFLDSTLAEEDPAVRAEWLAMQAMLLNAQGQPDQSLLLANEALAIVPEEDAYVRSLIYSDLAAAYIQKNDGPRVTEAYRRLIQYGRLAGSLLPELMGAAGFALYLMERGELRAAFDVASQAVDSVERSGTLPPISGALYGEIASIYYYWNEVEKAHRYYVRSAQVSKLSGYSDAEVYYHVILSRLALIEGDLELAAEEINTAVNLTEIEAPTAVREELLAQRVRVMLQQNQRAAAEMLLEPHGFVFHQELSIPELSDGQIINRPTGLLYTSALRILLDAAQKTGSTGQSNGQRTLQEAMIVADRLISTARSSQMVPILIEGLLLRARLHETAGDERAARTDVSAAIEAAHPEGVIITFVEEEAPVAGLVTRMAQDNELTGYPDEYTSKLMSAFPGRFGPDRRADHEPAAAVGMLVETLSSRELEILHLLGAGHTNQDIAKQLVITLHTVKKHCSNIYAKLGVRNRTQAVAKARELRLL